MPVEPEATPAVAQLRQSLTDLIAESQALRTDVHSAEKARRRTGQINVALLAMLGIFVGLLLAVTWQNNMLARQVSDTNARISDCTTPGGHCYQDNGKRTGSAISDIIRAEIFMAQCARLYPGESGPVFDQELQTCVAERLAGPSLSTPRATPSTQPAR